MIEDFEDTVLEQSIELFRASIPAFRNKIYMNFGAQGVLAQETIDALIASYNLVQEQGPLSGKTFRWLTEEIRCTRIEFASEFNCLENILAITQSTTDGCNIVFWGLPWQTGDHLLITDAEHSGVIAAARQLAKRHDLNLDIVPVAGCSDDQIMAALAEHIIAGKTRLFAYSHVLWTNGQLLPLKSINDYCRDRGVRTLVDGAQSAGVMPLDLPASAADFYAVTGHKWFGCPDGIGALYVREDALEKLEPTFVGWRSTKFDSAGKPTNWEEGAARFEVGTAAFPLLAGARAALALRRRHGTAAERYNLLLDNATRLRQGLSKIAGVQCFSSSPPACGLVSFTVEGVSHRKLCDRLEENNIIVRTLPAPDCLRASVHYFSSEAEIDQVLAQVQDLVAQLRATGDK